jgi:hypothetical protein
MFENAKMIIEVCKGYGLYVHTDLTKKEMYELKFWLKDFGCRIKTSIAFGEIELWITGKCSQALALNAEFAQTYLGKTVEQVQECIAYYNRLSNQ